MNREFPVSGGKVGFRVDPTPYDAFKVALEDEGFAKHCPNPRTDHSALVAVTGKAAGKDCKVVPRKKPKVNGVEVVRVDKHEQSANDYSTEMHTKVVGKAVYTDYGRDYTLTDEFLKTKAVLTAGAITKALKSILCDELHGLPDFDSRRIYVPEACLPRWNELAARLFGRYDDCGNLIAEGICGGEYVVDMVQINATTIRQIKSALEERINDKAVRIVMDVSKGTLSKEQLAKRAEEGQEMLAEISLYAEVLQETLEGLQKSAEAVTSMAAVAAFADMAS